MKGRAKGKKREKSST